MIPETQVRAQVRRLSLLERFGDLDPDMVSAVTAALAERANTPEHAAAIVDAWYRRSRWAPYPSDIHETAEMLAASGAFYSDAPKPERGCPRCGGTGWEQGWELVTETPTPGGGTYRRRDRVDPDRAEALRREVDGITQRVYSGVRRCRGCMVREVAA
jgi:hypothetical protein